MRAPAVPRILATTPRWWVIDKPAHWLSVPPSAGAPAELRDHVISEWVARDQGARAWPVHRLDRETSGVLLLARDADSHREANRWFEHHEVRKQYEFLAAGHLSAPLVKVRDPIGGAPAQTQFETLVAHEGYFHGRARPLTGKRHQIRIHLAGLGHPLLGDPKYGGPREFAGRKYGRVALHARRLELPTGEVFEAALPDDFFGSAE
jgi:23S rRNA-/tRNA-specific pseudouridylate synthase